MMKMDSKPMAVNMKSIAVFEPKHGSQFFLPSPNNLFPVGKLSCFPLTSLPTKAPKFCRLKAATNLACDQESKRTFEKLPPSPWTDQFHSVSVDVSEMDALRKEIDVLKTKVKHTLMFSKGIESTKKRILMINLLASLGLAHHFEEEIYEILKEGLEKEKEMMADEDDLHTVSIIFWFFRTYGHYMSSDVFTRFKENNGNFKESLKEDAKGILSLYEAAHLRTTTDYILDEALTFTSNHLESLDAVGGTCPPYLSMRIRNALAISQRWNMENVAAMEYIPSYELEKDHDEMLLKFSNSNFKLLQLHYLQELKIVTKWYKEADIAYKVPPFFRDRIVENFFYTTGIFCEPQASRARIMNAQLFTVFSFQDDIMDRNDSLSEVESLTKSLERWAPDHTMEKQPDYLKFVLNFILETFEDLGKEVRREGRPYSVEATIEEIKRLAKASCDLAKWVRAAHVPTFEEYMEVGIVEIAINLTFKGASMSDGEFGTKETYEWLKSSPKLVKLACIQCRLVNDIYGFENDMRRGYITNALNCYMNQYKVTKEEAVRELLKMLVDVQETINEELLMTTDVSRSALKTSFRIAQVISVCYNGYEGFTEHVGKITEYMNMMFVDQNRL